MLTHVVLIRPKAGLTAADFDSLISQAVTLGTRHCGAGGFDVGANSTEEPLDQGYEFGFILRFAGRSELAAYHRDPEHEPFSKHIQTIAETVLVFDLES